jgi:predicted transposase/invertase (TIGR01784 family)
MLPLDVPIESIEYLSGELTPEIPEIHNSIVDVRCVDTNGRQFIVEMQMYWTDSFTSRVLFNASKAYVKQLQKGKEYKYLQPVYALAFVNDIFEPTKPEEYYHHYKIVNVQDTNEQIKGLEFVFIELPKFKPGNKGEKKLHELWLDFLKIEDSTVQVPEELFTSTETTEALKYLEEGAYTEAQMNAYDHYWDSVSVEKTLYVDGYADGEADGMVKGKAEGMAEGMVKGEAKGKAEGKAEEKVEIAKNLKLAGVNIQIIAKTTGLSVDEIQEL